MNRFFDSTTVGFIIGTVILFLIAWGVKGLEIAKTSVKNGFDLFLRYGVLIVFSMIFASLLQTLIPRDIIVKYLGTSSGWRGIVLGTLIGALTPGSPYAAMPLFAGLIRTGVSFPVGVAMACAWGLLSIGRIPFEAAVMGGEFTLIKVISSLLLPCIAGGIAQLLQYFLAR
ncbi:MAG: hypothetical protein GX766_09260 [Firmicutes bacterium]|nr:hypothetical protein [Bacillota bacterium]